MFRNKLKPILNLNQIKFSRFYSISKAKYNKLDNHLSIKNAILFRNTKALNDIDNEVNKLKKQINIEKKENVFMNTNYNIQKLEKQIDIYDRQYTILCDELTLKRAFFLPLFFWSTKLKSAI